jgi:hypothetical protein
VHQCDVNGRCCPVCQLPRRLRQRVQDLPSHHHRASRLDDPIEIHHLQFGDWQSLCLCKEKKSNFSVRCCSKIGLSSQVGDDVTTLLTSTTGNTIPALVPATINRMIIGFSTFTSSKPSTAIYNWQATFSVTVNFILHQHSFCDIFIISDFLFSGLDRAKGVLVPLMIQVTPIHSMD